ncbi:hypothetical protein PGT21_002126 [Puccinia graminis f. sp. tritici]|uniref:Wax synthase domain-containing protein n=1 Tax=Puccinia graminis f. sp. tritici TaxID=56615 RepID=A0A5B0RVJ8_PUCGR|nr:hypothetical protein PGT21_002126 [Puccinia graminis f. sp. tritici]KAA1129991.1 hypothetical protein PGTUg99_008330 [Puccinia graminis f. sp. tritici]
MNSTRFVDEMDRFQLPTILKREYEYCQSLFGQRMVLHARRVNFKPVIMPLTTSFFFLWLCAVSLPEKGPLPKLFRLSVLPFLLASAFDIAVNKTYSLGSPLRDVMFPYWGCLIAFRIIDMALVSLWDEDPAPRWIKPQKLPEQENLHVAKSVISLKITEEKDVEEVSRALFDEGKGTWKSSRGRRYLWRPVPHSPLLSFDRALYGLDIILLNRPGTPWLFPWRLRSLEWSLVALNGQRREQLNFGKPEWPFLLALIQQVFHLMAHNYIRSMDLDGKRTETRDLWAIKLPDQILVTLALGAIVALSSSLEEAITFPLLLNSKFLPETALLGNTRRAILSKGLAELWGYRWHHNWRRSFVRTARLFPGGLNPTWNALWTFFLSGMMHSIMLARAYPTPTLSRPCTILPIFWEPGMMLFFMAQGIGTLIEKTYFPTKNASILKRIWMCIVLIGTGRYLVNSMVVKGWLSAYEWNQMNYGNVISDIFGRSISV